MKKIMIYFGIIFVVALIIVLSITQNNKIPEEIKIGVIIPLTGTGANYGEWTKNGIQIALDEINEKGIDGKKLKLVIEDHKNDPKEAVTIISNLINIKKIKVVLIITSTTVLAVAPIAERSHTVLFNTAGLNPQIRHAGDYIFSNIPDADVEVEKMAEFVVNKLGFHELALFHTTAGVGVGAKNALLRKFTELGGNIVAIDTHDEGNTDFRTQLVKLKQLHPEAVYLASITKESALILKQAMELGFKTQWLSYTPFQGPDIVNIAGKAADGVIYTMYSLTPDNQIAENFIKKYKMLYGSEPEYYAGTAYDGLKIIAHTIEHVGYDAEKIKNYLYTITDYMGVTGLTKFDEDGCVIKSPIFKTVKDGEFVIYGR